MPTEYVQKTVKVRKEDNEWLEENEQINFSALCRSALKDEREMREQYERDDSSKSISSSSSAAADDDRTI